MYGTGIGGIGTLERGKQLLIEQGEKKVPPLSVPLMMSNAAAGMLAMRYGMLGDSFGTVSACARALHAIAQADADDPVRRRRRRHHGRLGGGADAAVQGRVRAPGGGVAATGSRSRSTPGATGS